MHKLPELFEHIIEFDRTKPDTSGKVVPLTNIKEWKARRSELSAAAAAFVSRQRGNGGTA